MTDYSDTPDGRQKFDELYEQEEARRSRIRELWNRELQDLSISELIEILRLKHTAEEIPPCRICGGPLSITSIGGTAATKWACSGQEDDPENPGMLRYQPGRHVADGHYSQSRWTQHYDTDSHVIELVSRIETTDHQL